MTSGKSIRASQVHFEKGAHATAWLHFEMPDARHIILHGKVNNVAGLILLDSGVGAVVLSEDIAAALNLHTVGNLTGVGISGRASGQETEGVRIAFDNLTINTPTANIFNLSSFTGVLNEPIIAFLGRDAFDSLIVDIDFENKRLAFRDLSTQPTLPGGTELTLTRSPFGRRRLPISIEGRAPIQASFDLGSERALVLSPDYVSEQNLLADKKTSDAIGIGIGGEVSSEVASVDKLTVGQSTFHDVPVQVPKTWSLDCPAVVGFPILRRMRMIIDYPHDRVEVLPIKSLIDQPIRKDRSGIGARRLPGDKVQIIHVARGSPAEAAGLRIGDEVIAINDEKLSPEYFKNHPTVGDMAAGTILYLTLSNGSTVKLTLADYF